MLDAIGVYLDREAQIKNEARAQRLSLLIALCTTNAAWVKIYLVLLCRICLRLASTILEDFPGNIVNPWPVVALDAEADGIGFAIAVAHYWTAEYFGLWHHSLAPPIWLVAQQRGTWLH